MSGFDVSDVLVGVDPGEGDVGVLRACALAWDRLAAGFGEFVGHTGSAVGVLQDLSAVSVSALMSTLTARGDVVRGLACQAGVVAEAVRGYARDVEDVQSRVVSIRVQVRSDVDSIVGCARQVRYWCGQAGYVVAGGRRWDDVPPLVPECGPVSGVGVEYARNQYEDAVRNWRARVESLRAWQRQYAMVMDDRNTANVRFRRALGGVKISQQITQSSITSVVGSMVALLSGGSGVADVAGLWSVLLTLTTPDDVAAYWASLTDGQREALVDAHDDVIGNMNGVDYTSRDKANRKHMDEDRAETQCAYERWMPDLESGNFWQDESGIWHDEYGNTVTNPFQARKDVLDKLAEDFDNDKGLTATPPRYLICYDYASQSATELPRVAISFGDLDTAKNTATIVSGMNSSSADYRKVGTVAKSMYYDISQTTGVSTAVVVYLDYTSPDWSEEVGNSRADEGAIRFGSYLDGVNAVKKINGSGGFTNTVIAHSYGTTMTATALAKKDYGVDNFVMLSSAGLVDTVTNANQLHVPVDHVFAMISPSDGTAPFGQSSTGVHVTNPYNPVFGATVLGADGDTATGTVSSGEGHTLSPDLVDDNADLDHTRIASGQYTMLTPNLTDENNQVTQQATESYENVVNVARGQYGALTPSQSPWPRNAWERIAETSPLRLIHN